MKDFLDIPDEILKKVLEAHSLAIWPVDSNPLHDSYQIARFFEEEGWIIYPIHEHEERILDFPCFRDIRLIPDDYDILLLFVHIDQLPVVVNEIFNADFIPPLVWMHEGITDLESRDRLNESGLMVVMDMDLRDFFSWAKYHE